MSKSLLRGLKRVSPIRGVGIIALATAVVCLCVAPVAWATNGQEPVGWGQRAVGRGGADVAIGGGPLSMNMNPATLAQLARREFELGPQWLHTNQHFKNSPNPNFPEPPFNNQGNRKASRFDKCVLPNAALAIPVGEKLVIGGGMFAQAGLGSDYKLNHRFFPNREMDTEADFNMAKISLGAGVKVTDQLSLGAAANIGKHYFDVRAVQGPAWLNIKQAKGQGYGFTFGATYQPTDKLTIGASYATPVWNRRLETETGEIELSPLIGGGFFEYDKVYVDDFKFPQKAAFGVSYSIIDRWRVMGEVRWVDNDDSAFHHLKVRYRKGFHGVPDMDVALDLKQKEQLIWIFGTEFDITENLTVACGYNYGDNPVRSAYLVPVAPAITEHHITTGVRYHRESWYVGVSYVHAFTTSFRSKVNKGDLGIDYGNSRLDHNQDSIIFGCGLKF